MSDKLCSKCHTKKPVHEFTNGKRTCKECRNNISKDTYHNIKDTQKQKVREEFIENIPKFYKLSEDQTYEQLKKHLNENGVIGKDSSFIVSKFNIILEERFIQLKDCIEKMGYSAKALPKEMEKLFFDAFHSDERKAVRYVRHFVMNDPNKENIELFRHFFFII